MQRETAGTSISKALDRCMAHERRRRFAWHRLPDRELMQIVRGVNAVDRAVANYRRVSEEERAA
jgi:hypothetical protein